MTKEQTELDTVSRLGDLTQQVHNLMLELGRLRRDICPHTNIEYETDQDENGQSYVEVSYCLLCGKTINLPER